MAIKYLILTVLIAASLIYSLIYTVKFRETKLFTGNVRTFHLVMIWLVPFIWIFILKSITKSTPGSHEFPDKNNSTTFTESGLGIWADPSSND
ncbi:hypothetical protein BH11BAC3_BH11BAC3_20810 [soil metagenome]